MARALNVETAQIVAKSPERFGFFATLCLPDVGGSIDEARRALAELKADGIVLMTNTDGIYMGDPSLEPLMGVLNEHHAVVFLHPGALPAQLAAGVPAYVADFLLDTVRTAVGICKADWFEKFPNVRFILSHAGGFIPFAAYRIARACARDGDTTAGMKQLKRFYLDTAVASSPTSLPEPVCLRRHLAHHFRQRSSFYANATRAGAFTSTAPDAYLMDATLRSAIARQNVLALFLQACPLKTKAHRRIKISKEAIAERIIDQLRCTLRKGAVMSCAAALSFRRLLGRAACGVTIGQTTYDVTTSTTPGSGTVLQFTTQDLNALGDGGKQVTLTITNGTAAQIIVGDVSVVPALSFNVASGQTITDTNQITGPGIVLTGGGTLVLENNNNTYTGGTTVENGTLLIDGTNGNSAITVENGATIGGNGTAGAVTVDSGGTFTPGDPSTFTVASLTLSSGAAFDEEIGGTSPGTGGAGRLRSDRGRERRHDRARRRDARCVAGRRLYAERRRQLHDHQ